MKIPIYIGKSKDHDMKPLKFFRIPKTASSAISECGKTNGWGVGDPIFKSTYNIPELSDNPIAWDDVCGLYDNQYGIIAYYEHLPLWTSNHPDIINYDWFCVVRNPYDRMISFYHYLITYWYKSDEPYTKKYFNDIIQDWMKKTKGLKFNIFCPQYDYIYQGEVKVIQHVLKYENLESEFSSLMNTYGIDKQLIGKVNCLGKCQFNIDDMTDETKDLIREHYYKDFETFNYSM